MNRQQRRAAERKKEKNMGTVKEKIYVIDADGTKREATPEEEAKFAEAKPANASADDQPTGKDSESNKARSAELGRKAGAGLVKGATFVVIAPVMVTALACEATGFVMGMNLKAAAQGFLNGARKYGEIRG